MANLVNNAIEQAIAKEAKKLVDIKGLAKKVAAQVTKDVNKMIKKGGFFNEDSFSNALEDCIDYWKIARVVSKSVNEKLMKSVK